MEINYEERRKNRIVVINKNNKEYKIDISLSFGKYKRYKELAENNNFNTAFIETFLENIDKNEFNEKDINYIILKIVDYYKIEEIYNSINEKDIYKRIYDTLNQYEIKMFNELKKSLTDSVTNILKNINTDFTKIFENISNSLNILTNILEENFSNIIKSLPTEDELQQRKENYKLWGELGWTVIPSMELNFFDEVPQSQIKADEKCLSIINEEELNEIINYIENNIEYKEKFNEAIQCFNNNFYLATAMIIVSLIERNLSALPLKADNGKKIIGIKTIDEFINELKIDEKDFIYFFYVENLISYLKMFFEYIENFEPEPNNINRNFLMHGWSNKVINKTDCIKLFLVLYNILMLWKYDK